VQIQFYLHLLQVLVAAVVVVALGMEVV